MSEPSDTPMSRRTLAGRVVAGVWAINFLLLITETVTYRGQSSVSFALAITAVALLLRR